MAQPAWEEMHTDARRSERMRTVSTWARSAPAAQSHFVVSPSALDASVTGASASGSASTSRSRSARGSAVASSSGMTSR